MEGAPRVHSLGDRGGCATGAYRTPTTLGHITKTRSHSSSTYCIETKHREADKMRRQRNMAQIKETQKKELNKMEISNLSDAQFKTLVIRMFKELSADLNSIKKIQSEMKDTLIEI